MVKFKFSILFLLALLIFVSFPANADTVSPTAFEAGNYFPLAVGNEWTYVRSGQVIYNQTILVNVTAKMQPSGSTVVYYQLNNFNGQAHWVTQSAGIVSEYPGNLWYMLNGDVGQSWTMSINTSVPGVIPGSNGAVIQVISRNETVTVPAGTFTAVHLRFTTGISDAGITDEWFAPGIGLVKRVESSIAGAVTTVLTRAVVNGIVIDKPLVAISVTTDKPIYWEDHMPGTIPPAFGPEIKIFCTVKPLNNLSTVLNFSDYNVWDVSVINPNGVVVWTNPKVLTPAPVGGVNRTIPGAGETTEFRLQLPYGSMQGKYLVVARLLVSSNAPAPAYTNFQYSWAW